MAKNPPANARDMRLRFDPLEEGMATHSGILAWRIPWTEESGVQRVAQSRTRLN